MNTTPAHRHHWEQFATNKLGDRLADQVTFRCSCGTYLSLILPDPINWPKVNDHYQALYVDVVKILNTPNANEVPSTDT